MDGEGRWMEVKAPPPRLPQPLQGHCVWSYGHCGAGELGGVLRAGHWGLPESNPQVGQGSPPLQQTEAESD